MYIYIHTHIHTVQNKKSKFPLLMNKMYNKKKIKSDMN